MVSSGDKNWPTRRSFQWHCLTQQTGGMIWYLIEEGAGTEMASWRGRAVPGSTMLAAISPVVMAFLSYC